MGIEPWTSCTSGVKGCMLVWNARGFGLIPVSG